MCDAYSGDPSESWAFAITGTVTWCRGNNFIIKDSTGNCNLFNIPDDTLARGEIIAATGLVHITESRTPWIDYIEAIKFGFDDLPVPRRTILKDCIDPALILEGVCTEATVVDILKDEFDARYDWLILKDGGATMSAVCRHAEGGGPLIGSRVEVTGPVCHYVLGMRNFINPFINTELGGSVRVISQPSEDPFDFPLIAISGYASQSDIECLGKHTAVGRIVAVWPPNNCLLLTPDRRYIRLSLAANESAPKCGSMVRAVGYPSSDIFTVWLTLAKTREEKTDEIPDDVPVAMKAKDLLPKITTPGKSLPANMLVTVDGTVKSVDILSDGTRRATLDDRGTTVPVDFSAKPDAFDGIDVGSEIRATGRCILVNERWNPNNVFPKVTEALIILSENPVVIHGPGWWSIRKVLVVVAILVIALMILQLRNFLQKRMARIKLNERTQLAVEIHDSLSQTLTGLACHISAARNTIDTDTPVARDKLTTANQMLLSCRAELRNCLFDLRNNTLEEKDFGKAIVRTLEPFEDSAAILVRFNVDRSKFEDLTAHAILAIIRELASNAIRHGHAWTIRVAGAVENNTLLFSVTDDGSGFDFENRMNSEDGHFGLDGIHDRLKRLNGSIAFSRPAGGGTKATVKLPIGRK